MSEAKPIGPIHMGMVTDGKGIERHDEAFLTVGSEHGQDPGDCEIVIKGARAREVACLIAAAPDLETIIAGLMIYGVDERDGVIWLRYAGKDICKIVTNSPSGIALLKLEADRRAAIAKSTGAPP